MRGVRIFMDTGKHAVESHMCCRVTVGDGMETHLGLHTTQVTMERCGLVEREVRLPDVSHYPATAYSGPMIRWRFLAAADVRRALFSSPSVDRPMCAKQHHT